MSLWQELGFPRFNYSMQRMALSEARRLGWLGNDPSVLGTYTAELAIDSALEFLKSKKYHYNACDICNDE